MTNRWWEIKILCEPVLEDLIFWRLEKFGCRGTASEQKGQSRLLRAYSPQIKAQPIDMQALSEWLRKEASALELSPPIIEWHLIDEEDWASSWKQHWQPQEIGDRFLIYPAWLTPPTASQRVVIRLDPGAAFGTGVHPTTQLCLEALEVYLSGDSQEERVIADIGCGSGILSIGAILLGAQRAYAVDVDPLAVRATHHNCELNQIAPEQIIVETGSVEQIKELAKGGVDGIVCNILAEVIVNLMPQITAIAKPGAWGILSGILLSQTQQITDILEQHSWKIEALLKRENWCCFQIRRV